MTASTLNYVLPGRRRQGKTEAGDALFAADQLRRPRILRFAHACWVYRAGVAAALPGGADLRRHARDQGVRLAVRHVPRVGPNRDAEKYGALDFLAGSLTSAIGALLVAGPIGILVATFIHEVAPFASRSTLRFVIEMLATVPSVVYGLWGFYVLGSANDDAMAGQAGQSRKRCPHLSPIFAKPADPKNMLCAILILSIMVLPIIVAVSLDAILRQVPSSYREAALGLGATRWEMIRLGRLAAKPHRIYRRMHPGAGPGDGRDDGRDDGHRQRPGLPHEHCSQHPTPSPARSRINSTAARELLDRRADRNGAAALRITLITSLAARFIIRRAPDNSMRTLACRQCDMIFRPIDASDPLRLRTQRSDH